jgi:phenylacetate-coenzyme A ligase PaaK-like adenylate-forming protein
MEVARVGASVDSPFLPVRRFDSIEPLETIVAGLNTWQPENLIAYASMARVLAEEQLAGRLRISPGAVMSASEVLTQASRAKIERAWGRQPFDVYAATETAAIARGARGCCGEDSDGKSAARQGVATPCRAPRMKRLGHS